ncbi:hypothetical protein IAQ61_000754 [Plenodomus lingam]|uniref:uncharacterized protein n=1 Tax=Leptosphaeria maculans TaxID=5022 RepID=UPI00331F2A11|nr:hypothetical protein IAQ61_000754 [Plenodomus lingam]
MPQRRYGITGMACARPATAQNREVYPAARIDVGTFSSLVEWGEERACTRSGALVEKKTSLRSGMLQIFNGRDSQ